jgi:3-deoxy-D-manno-octulosonate 8-phosphate phosphatase (KDO 8-P phosphatase)
MKPPLAERIAKVRMLILDVDGVLTDGSIAYSSTGEELKRFHVRDGSGLKLWQRAGMQVAILSGRSSPAVARRASELGISILYQGRSDKLAALCEILEVTQLRPQQVCAIGDDLQDLPMLEAVGVAVAVADACLEVRQAADSVTITPGGHGAFEN